MTRSQWTSTGDFTPHRSLKYCNTFNRTRTAALLKARSEKEKEEELKQMHSKEKEADFLAMVPPPDCFFHLRAYLPLSLLLFFIILPKPCCPRV